MKMYQCLKTKEVGSEECFTKGHIYKKTERTNISKGVLTLIDNQAELHDIWEEDVEKYFSEVKNTSKEAKLKKMLKADIIKELLDLQSKFNDIEGSRNSMIKSCNELERKLSDEESTVSGLKADLEIAKDAQKRAMDIIETKNSTLGSLSDNINKEMYEHEVTKGTLEAYRTVHKDNQN